MDDPWVESVPEIEVEVFDHISKLFPGTFDKVENRLRAVACLRVASFLVGYILAESKLSKAEQVARMSVIMSSILREVSASILAWNREGGKLH